MTKEEIYKTPMFKVVKRFLLTKYPFIKDVLLNDDVDRYDSIWFLNVIIDANQANETYDLGGFNSWVFQQRRIFNRDVFVAVYLSLIFKDDAKSTDLQREIEKELYRIQKSDVTKEMRLRKSFSISEYIYPLPPDTSTIPN
jgi:hypothetical protein